MNKKTKNIIIYSAVGLIILLMLFYKFFPAENIANIFGRENVASKILCAVPINVSGDSMEPFLKNGEKINFTKCFEKDQIKKNTIVMFKEKKVNRIAVIDTIDDDKVKLFQPNRSDKKISDINIEDILAIYEKTYTGNSSDNNAEKLAEPLVETSEWKNLELKNLLFSTPIDWQLMGEENGVFIIKNTAENGFQTYFTLTEDKIEKSLNEYAVLLKNNIKIKTPEISFSNENFTKINNREVFAMDGELSQQNMDFKVLIAVIKENNSNNVWVFSFNSLKENWDKNDDIFIKILESFEIIK